MTTRAMRLHQPIDQAAEGKSAARPPVQPAADLAFEIIGDGWADGLDVGTLFAQAAARMGDNVWMGCLADDGRTVYRMRVGRGPVYSGGDRARFALVFEPRLLAARLTANAFHPQSYLLMDEPDPATAQDRAVGFTVPHSAQRTVPTTKGGLVVYRVPWRALASRIPAFPQGQRLVALGLLTWLFGHDPDLSRRLLESRLAPRGRRLVSAALRLFELGWREAPCFVPDQCRWRLRRMRAVAETGCAGSGSDTRATERARGSGAAGGAARAAGERIEVMSGHHALALGALTAGFTGCVSKTDHPVAQRWLRTFKALGGRVRTAWEAGLGLERGHGASFFGNELRAEAAHDGPSDAGGSHAAVVHAAGDVPLLVEVAGGVGDWGGLHDGVPAVAAAVARVGDFPGEPRVTLRIERAPSTDGSRCPLGTDPLAAMSGCPGTARPVVLAPTTVEECFHFVGLARRLAQQYRSHCVLLVDAALLGAVQVWPRRDGAREGYLWREWLGDAVVEKAAEPAVTDAVDGLLARLGVAPAALSSFVRAPRPVGGESGQVLLVGWGSTRGPVEEAVERLRARGLAVSSLHLRLLSPWPRELGQVLARFRHVVAVEVEDDRQAARRRAYHLVYLLRAALSGAANTGRLAAMPNLTARVFSGPTLFGPAAVEAWTAAFAAAAQPPLQANVSRG